MIPIMISDRWTVGLKEIAIIMLDIFHHNTIANNTINSLNSLMSCKFFPNLHVIHASEYIMQMGKILQQ